MQYFILSALYIDALPVCRSLLFTMDLPHFAKVRTHYTRFVREWEDGRELVRPKQGEWKIESESEKEQANDYKGWEWSVEDFHLLIIILLRWIRFTFHVFSLLLSLSRPFVSLLSYTAAIAERRRNFRANREIEKDNVQA